MDKNNKKNKILKKNLFYFKIRFFDPELAAPIEKIFDIYKKNNVFF